MNFKKAIACLACGSQDLVAALELTPTPLTDAYKATSAEAIGMKRYPLKANICKYCGHVQLSILVEPEESYTDYLYVSNLTTGLSQAFQEYAECLSDFKKKIAILDIGSNDGSFIAACQQEGHAAFGVEPSKDLASFANQNGRPTINGYFNQQSLMQLQTDFKMARFDVVSFNNVLANIQSPHEALSLARNILKNNSSRIFVQTGYHPTQFSKGLFDYIYHEHYSYFSLSSIAELARRSKLKITQAKTLDIRGGSIRIELSPIESDREEFKVVEKHERFITSKDFENLRKVLELSKISLAQTLAEEANNGYIIYGYGASHSTGTLLHYFQLEQFIDILVDENSIKHLKFMPGTNLQVKNPEIIYDKTGDKSAVVVLAWQYFDQISNKLRSKGYKGKIIRPVLP